MDDELIYASFGDEIESSTAGFRELEGREQAVAARAAEHFNGPQSIGDAVSDFDIGTIEQGIEVPEQQKGRSSGFVRR